jgi:SAM-dependent methyltransferase
MGRKNFTKFLIDPEFEMRVRNTFYDSFYSKTTDSEVLWRDFGAREKCVSILKLCNGLTFEKVVEVGCGYGNILSLLDRLKFAPKLYGLEVSPSAIKYLEEKTNIPRLKTVYLVDTSKTPFEDDFFDLGILSHVLEHVPDPKNLLMETLRICRYVLVEVPLEDCLLPNLYARYQLGLIHRQRIENISGHINFFSKSTAADLFRESGSEILKERTYRSSKVFYTDFRTVVLLKYLQSALFYLVFLLTKSRIVGSHYAVLLRKRNGD